MDSEKIKAFMSEIPQFDKLTYEEREILSRHIDFKEVPAGEMLVREGSIGDSLFYILSGKIEIERESVKGHQAVMARFGKGSSVGEMSLINDHLARSATARSIEEAELLVLTKASFDRIVLEYPRIAIKILQNIASSLSERLRHTSGRFADILD
jgi:CRP-like cAMP-binding protein